MASAAAEFGLADGVEITTEANPDSVAAWDLEELRTAGFNRISFGMQSAVDHVLRTLDRTHDPMRVPAAVEWARQAGFEDVSLDLIYGTPGESLADWETSVEAALACEPDHVSAYSLIVEEGTALARQVRRGELPMPDEDDLADKYLLADERSRRRRAALVRGVQLGHLARPLVPPQPALLDRRRTGGASGPGAHSHVGGVRWWNVKHPAAYAERLGRGVSPAMGREVLGYRDQRVERVLLEIRLVEGLPVTALDAHRPLPRRPARRRRPASSSPPSGWCSPSAAGCSPTPSSATSSTELSALASRLRARAAEVSRRSAQGAVVKSISSSTRPSSAGSRSAYDVTRPRMCFHARRDVGLVAVRPAELLAGAGLPVDALGHARASAGCRAGRA